MRCQKNYFVRKWRLHYINMMCVVWLLPQLDSFWDSVNHQNPNDIQGTPSPAWNSNSWFKMFKRLQSVSDGTLKWIIHAYLAGSFTTGGGGSREREGRANGGVNFPRSNAIELSTFLSVHSLKWHSSSGDTRHHPLLDDDYSYETITPSSVSIYFLFLYFLYYSKCWKSWECFKTPTGNTFPTRTENFQSQVNFWL